MSPEWKERYNHPLWQMKRLEMMKKLGPECSNCGTREKRLNTHHRYYFSGRMPWEYPDCAYVILCDDCHKLAHSGEADKWESELIALFGLGRTNGPRLEGPSLAGSLIEDFYFWAIVHKCDARDFVMPLKLALCDEKFVKKLLRGERRADAKHAPKK